MENREKSKKNEGDNASKYIKKTSYHNKLENWKRWDVMPIFILYLVAFSNMKFFSQVEDIVENASTDSLSPLHNDSVQNLTSFNSSNLENMTKNSTIPSEEVNLNLFGSFLLQSEGSFGLILVFIVHIFSFLWTHWSIRFKVLLHFSKVKTVKEATFILVEPQPNKGRIEMVPLQRQNEQLFFFFQKRKFIWDSSSNQFKKNDYPVHKSFRSYYESEGYQSTQALENAILKYGKNQFDIPIPKFAELYKEQAVAPFFVFQIFCVLLWCLDEYWMYSLFTLFMVLVLEATVVTSRLVNLQQLRNMGAKNGKIQAKREGKWQWIEAKDLLPGDLVSLTPSKPEIKPPTNTVISAVNAVTNTTLINNSNSANNEFISPCDILLLDGSCVVNEAMLTGESTPRVKESISNRNLSEELSIKEDNIHVLFGGTKIIQQSPEKKWKGSGPDGCTGFVLRSGFDSGQGKLMRMILFSTERITANTKESLLFILLLLVFAIMASGYVLMKGIEQERNQYKLYLKCILILTSVVPPELPMELSMAVNNSLIALQRLGIFCTEPFRIPYAGKIDVCCFDKTGTLTSDNILCKGVVNIERDKPMKECLIDPKASSESTLLILAGCHSLKAMDDGKLVGDPMEVATLKAIDWSLNKSDVAASRQTKSNVKIHQRFHFTSSLKRMSAVVTKDGENFAVTKGAPEKISTLLKVIPEGYEETFKYFAAEGCRVLALAYKPLPNTSLDRMRSMTRESAESELIFGGFVAFDCPLKEGSLEAIQKIQFSSHEVCMITGDNTLTACYVASQLKIAKNPILILTYTGGNYEWVSVDEAKRIPVGSSESVPLKLLKEYDLCVSGLSLPFFMNDSLLAPHLSKVSVFARIAPDQKESILTRMRENGQVTLMCGDGTNDVGALKQAHVGVALLNNPVVTPTKPEVTATAASNSILAAKSASARREAMMKAMKDSQDSEGNTMVQLGDASIASPFTSKGQSVMCVIHIIRQGRCTLVTTTQMFKILALNCLISAYCLSILYLDGIKLGDTQATISGILIAACFLFVSRSKPLDTLAKEKPDGSIFSPYMLLSILGQFMVHLYCLMSVVTLAREHSGETTFHPYSTFQPNLINSGVYIISCSMQLATFAINYKGHPFMESLKENHGLRLCLLITFGLVVSLALEISSSFNQTFQLVEFPGAFSRWLALLIFIDLGGSWAVEWICSKFLSTNK